MTFGTPLVFIVFHQVECKGQASSMAHLKPCRTSEGKTKMDLQETGWGDVDWIKHAQDKDKKRVFLTR